MALVTYDDYSGTSTPVTSNPYDGILEACKNDSRLIQARYNTHRITRNAQQKQKILSPEFSGWILDSYLTKLAGPQKDPTFTDPRNCLVFWARPPQHVQRLISVLQQKLLVHAPGLWLMPIPNLHLTAMEITHSLTEFEIEMLVTALLPTCQIIADLPSSPEHSARLIKPMLSFDAAALALSFVPAAGEGLDETPNTSEPTSIPATTTITTDATSSPRTAADDSFTYHHLRRSLHSLINQTVPVASRYVVPSAHLTIARFNTPNPFASPDDTGNSANTGDKASNPLNTTAGIDLQKRENLIQGIEEINQWLQNEYWPRRTTQNPTTTANNGEPTTREIIPEGGQWVVGEEKGLDFRKGTLWYGDGETVYLGKGREGKGAT